MCYGDIMMIRGLTVSLLFAVLALPAYAQDSESSSEPQDNPQTRQTDQSEDDYRRSQRRRDTGDIFDDIDINTRSSGSGGILGREVKAIDRLDQESRRHLNKQRAKALAEAQPGEPIDAAYEPSDTAKTDEYVAQEKAAWNEMMREANSGLSGISGQGGGAGGGQGGGQGDQQGQGQAGAGQPGQMGQGQSGQGQSGQGQDSSQNKPSTSPLRGGSASSASSILDQIKGRTGSSPSGTSSQGSPSGSGGGNAPQTGQTAGAGQASQGQATEANSAQSGQAQQDENTVSAQSDGGAQSQSQASVEAASDSTAPKTAAEAAAHQRLKRDPVERNDTGGRTSASDYLNRKKD